MQDRAGERIVETGLEAWLRSSWRRALLIVAVVLVASFATSAPFEVFLGDEPGPDRGQLFAVQAIYWGAWALAGIPIAAVGVWLYKQLGMGWLFALAQVLLSLGVAWLFQDFHRSASERMMPELFGPRDERAADRGERGERGERFGVAGRGWQGRRSESRQERLPGSGEEQRDEGLEERPRPRSAGPDGGSGEGVGSGRWRRGDFDGRRRSMRSFWRAAAFQRELLVYWVVLALGLGSHAFLASRVRERRQTELDLESERLRTELARAEVGNLERQINPHFLFNALHSVGGLIRADEKPVALEMLSSLGDLLRMTLARGEDQESTLADEVEVARRYVAIEQIRFGERLEVEISIEAAAAQVSVPSLILLPLVENAVRYGVEPRTEGGRVAIRARVRGEADAQQLEIDVEDDGPGFPADVLARSRQRRVEPLSALALGSSGGHGIGLANGRARLAMLYGSQARLELSNLASGGARVHIELPCGPGADRPERS